MNARSSMIHVRMDNDLKDRATEALAAMGLSTADAVRLLSMHRHRSGLPARAKVPNAKPVQRWKVDEFKNGGKPRFDNADDMFAELEEESPARGRKSKA